jgi:hypothetical protein
MQRNPIRRLSVVKTYLELRRTPPDFVEAVFLIL